jgi:hypothetical protein
MSWEPVLKHTERERERERERRVAWLGSITNVLVAC